MLRPGGASSPENNLRLFTEKPREFIDIFGNSFPGSIFFGAPPPYPTGTPAATGKRAKLRGGRASPETKPEHPQNPPGAHFPAFAMQGFGAGRPTFGAVAAMGAVVFEYPIEKGELR